jgi:hypothetical protein
MSERKKSIASLALVAGVLAMQAATFATAAEAYDRGSRRSIGQHRTYDHRPYATYGQDRRPYLAGHARRDRTGDAIGAAILSIGALIVGATIADAARRQRYIGDHD